MRNSSNERTAAATVASPAESATTGVMAQAFPADAAGLTRPEQVTLVSTHQQERWQRGERALLEEYLQQLPTLQDDAGALLYLVMHEVSLREENGETPSLA